MGRRGPPRSGSLRPVIAALLGGFLVLGAGGEGTVYHYRDAHGVDHYVNHPEQVPHGASADPVRLDEDLNPELAREMAENAHRAAEETKAKAAEAARALAAEQAAKGIAAESPAGTAVPVSAPPEARLLLVWAIAFSVVFLVLWSIRGLLLRSPSLAVAFQPVRYAAAAAALLSWIFLAVVARGWIADRFPPLRAVSRARANVDKINRQQKAAEQELDKSLNGR
jgi:hypothetical protein